jgi:hypothetical protein
VRAAVLGILRAYGALAYGQLGGAYSGRGLSDLIACYRGRFLALEIKSARGRVRPEQQTYLENVQRAGGIAAIIRTPEEVADLLMSIDLSDILTQNPNVGEAKPAAEERPKRRGRPSRAANSRESTPAGERATAHASTGDDERANGDESTEEPERANGDESTVPKERAKQDESIVEHERATLLEGTNGGKRISTALIYLEAAVRLLKQIDTEVIA